MDTGKFIGMSSQVRYYNLKKNKAKIEIMWEKKSETAIKLQEIRKRLKPLSKEASQLREPAFNPVDLLCCSSDPVHVDIGQPRPVKANRIKKNCDR